MWYALQESGDYVEFQLEHVRKGRTLRYEMAADHSEWTITDVSEHGEFKAIPTPSERGRDEEPYTFKLLIKE